MFRSVRTALLAAGCAAVALTGCTATVQKIDQPTIPKQNFEQGISDALQKSVGQRPDSVECPGPVKAQAGESARCVLTAGSTRYGLTAVITSYDNGQAHYQVQVDNKPMT